MNRAVFVDRDGVIIEDGDYVHRMEDLRLIPGALSALRALDEAGFLIIIVTNQAGIARGYFTEEDYRGFTGHLLSILSDGGVKVAGVYYCPHHPTEGIGVYRVECLCRKPRTGMLQRASNEHGVEASSSWLIGDKTSDIKAGRDFGLKTVLVMTGYGGKDGQCGDEPDYIAADLPGAARLILQNQR